MELARTLTEAVERLLATGRVEVRENGAWLAALEGFRYEVRPQRDGVLLHVWSPERNLVRRVLRIVDDEPGRISLEVARQARAGAQRLEFVTAAGERPTGRVAREQFRARFRDLLVQHFSDEKVTSLTAAADLEHSLSGNYTRGVMEGSSQAWAVLGAGCDETSATYDALLTFGLVWLNHTRHSARRKTVAGLRLFFPPGVGRTAAHRLHALSTASIVELYEYTPESWRARRVDARDLGNIETWLIPRRETEAVLAQADQEIERLRHLVPGAIEAEAVTETREVTLRFRGLPFAQWRDGRLWYGIGDARETLTPDRQRNFEQLVRDLDTHRSPLASAKQHRLYRAQPERWLQSVVAADPTRVDARLDPRFLYAQVPALAGSERGVIDLLGVTRAGRLAVLELKAHEDVQLVLQAAEYWLRVSQHHAQGEFPRYGYFPGITLDPRPPLLFLVAPALRFHPTSDALLRYLDSDIEVCRVGVSEQWRRGLKVVLRQGRAK